LVVFTEDNDVRLYTETFLTESGVPGPARVVTE